MLQKFQKSAELVVKILGKGIMGLATQNMRIHFVVFICLDNGQSTIEDILSCEGSQILKCLLTNISIVVVA